MRKFAVVLNWVMVAFIVLGGLLVNIRFQNPQEQAFLLGVPFAAALLCHYFRAQRWLLALSLVSNALFALIILVMFFEIPTLLRDFGHYGRSYVAFGLIAIPVFLNIVTAISDLRSRKVSQAIASLER
jgi:drug/metabolite transporter superfamily protein YnfA